MKLKHLAPGVLPLAAICGHLAQAAAGDEASATLALAHEWATAAYEIAPEQREAAFSSLAARAADAVGQFPNSAEVLAWQGIILSSYAGAKGGLGALGLAKDALRSLEAARKLDERALAGGIDTSIGALYYRVPGWPLGFGDDDKAEKYLVMGLAINPEGIDENYFYGDFLAEQGRSDEAIRYLKKALAAAPRPGREDADTGRRAEIEADLKKLAD
jgi:tetratricopeptide (TPR) repeat protein